MGGWVGTNSLSERFGKDIQFLAPARNQTKILRTYSLTPNHYTDWAIPVSIGKGYLLSLSRVILEKLTGSQLVKKSPAFYATLRFITAFTSARHLLLS